MLMLIYPKAVFTARCYAIAALAVMRCLSVRLSDTFVDSVETNKHIFKISSPSSSHTILHSIVFFRIKRHGNFPTEPPNGDVECKWGRQKSRC